MPAGVARNRLGLAHWLASPENPLTARVTVNRFWQHHFGTGLVKTAENFGVQGEPPSHPELLDWLATEFVRTGWDVKAMHRLIVTSATYRQSSSAKPALVARDPENRLLARGPRFRLPAEVVRDNALAIGGSLVEQDRRAVDQAVSAGGPVGGAGRRRGRGTLCAGQGREALPPQPLRLPQADRPAPGDGHLRRPQPRDLPGQAAAHQHARSRPSSCSTTSPTSRPRGNWRSSCWNKAARAPTSGSPSPSAGRWRACRRRASWTSCDAGWSGTARTFDADKDAAVKLIRHGESPPDPKLDPVELAAYTATASVILNLDETITLSEPRCITTVSHAHATEVNHERSQLLSSSTAGSS